MNEEFPGWRVLFLAGSLGTGGAPAYLASKARWLRARGIDVTVVSAGGIGSEVIDGLGVTHIRIGALRSPASTARPQERTAAVKAMEEIAEMVRPTVVEAAWPSAAEYGEILSAAKNLPLMVVELNDHLGRKRYSRLIEKWVGNGQLVVAYRDARRSISLATGVDTTSCPFLPIPVRLPGGPGIGRPPEAEEPVVIATVSRLDRSKRYLAAFMADAVAVEWSGGVRVRVVGDGDDRQRLERLARRWSGRDRDIEFVGINFDIREALRDVHVFVGQGTAAVQAASLGLPVVLAGIRAHAGRSPGVFGADPFLSIGDPFPGQMVRTFRHQIEALMYDADSWQRASDKGRRVAQEHFDVERVMAKQVELYGILVGRWQSGMCRTEAATVKLDPVRKRTRRAWSSVSPRTRSLVAFWR